MKHANVRRIVLNKTKQSQVVNVHNKSGKYLTSECIVLHLEMSSDSSLLRVRAGNGKKFKLALMQGVHSAHDIPKEIDVAAGDMITKQAHIYIYTDFVWVYVLVTYIYNRFCLYSVARSRDRILVKHMVKPFFF